MRLNKDNVINAICIFGMVISICIMLIVILKSFYSQQIDISFIKDIFSIGATLAAALIAISLFNDWKEQHNKTILAPEAIEIYKLINGDIITSAEYITFIRSNLNKNLHSVLAVEILESFAIFIKVRTERTVSLKYFSTLAKNQRIEELIREYTICIENHLNYLNSILRSRPVPIQRSMDQQFIDKNDIFTKELVLIQKEINKALSDYIIVK